MRLLTIVFLLISCSIFAQKRPDQQPTKIPEGTDAIYTQENPVGVIRKIKFDKAREYFLAKNEANCVTTVPPSLDPTSTYKGKIVTLCATNRKYYVDGDGRAQLIYEPSAGSFSAGAGININTSGVISNLGDTNASDDITTATALNGDLNGSLPNPTVDALQGRSLSSVAPAIGHVLKWTGNAWTPSPDNNQTYNAGPGVSLSGNQFSANDVSNTNELQQLQLSGSVITLTQGGGTITIPSSADNAAITAGAGITLTGAPPAIQIAVSASSIDSNLVKQGGISYNNLSPALKDRILNIQPSTEFVICIDGQSNAVGWQPNSPNPVLQLPNLKVWNGSAWVQPNLGAAPFNLNGAENIGLRFAERLALERPDVNVKIIASGLGAMPISYWLNAPKTGQTVTAGKVAASGVSKVDLFIWVQGESDSPRGSEAYYQDFYTLLGQWKTYSWFTKETRHISVGLYTGPGSIQGFQNETLKRIGKDANAFTCFASVDSLPAYDPYHYTHNAMVAIGKERVWNAFCNCPYNSTTTINVSDSIKLDQTLRKSASTFKYGINTPLGAEGFVQVNIPYDTATANVFFVKSECWTDLIADAVTNNSGILNVDYNDGITSLNFDINVTGLSNDLIADAISVETTPHFTFFSDETSPDTLRFYSLNSSQPVSAQAFFLSSASQFCSNQYQISKASDSERFLTVSPFTGWSTEGNSGLTPGTDFLGTNDGTPLEIKVQNSRVGILTPQYTRFGNGVVSGRHVTGTNVSTDVNGLLGAGVNSKFIGVAGALQNVWPNATQAQVSNIGYGMYIGAGNAIFNSQTYTASPWGYMIGSGAASFSRINKSSRSFGASGFGAIAFSLNSTSDGYNFIGAGNNINRVTSGIDTDAKLTVVGAGTDAFSTPWGFNNMGGAVENVFNYNARGENNYIGAGSQIFNSVQKATNNSFNGLNINSTNSKSHALNTSSLTSTGVLPAGATGQFTGALVTAMINDLLASGLSVGDYFVYQAGGAEKGHGIITNSTTISIYGPLGIMNVFITDARNNTHNYGNNIVVDKNNQVNIGGAGITEVRFKADGVNGFRHDVTTFPTSGSDGYVWTYEHGTNTIKLKAPSINSSSATTITVTGTNPGIANANAASAGVPVGSAYKWDDGATIHLCFRR